MVKKNELPKSIESPFTGTVLNLVEREEDDFPLAVYIDDDEGGPEYTDGEIMLYQDEDNTERLYVVYE